MIEIEELKKKYQKIILWGCVEKYVPMYMNYLEYKWDYIIDIDTGKQNKIYYGLEVKAPISLMNEKMEKIAVVILPIYQDKKIYNFLKLNNICCDIFLHDCIEFNRNISPYQESRFYYSEGRYSAEKHVQILVFLLKAHGIKKIIVSPGTLNIPFVCSVQSDPFFEVYSCVDERSAAYMACGMSQTTGEPVVLSCTGATASRNYFSGLTEAFYDKLPILVITSSQKSYKIGNDIEQVTDRTTCSRDIIKFSVEVDDFINPEERGYCELKINKALLNLKFKNKGPVHINLIKNSRGIFSVKTLPKCRKISLIDSNNYPLLKGKIGIYIKSMYKVCEKELVEEIEEFCEKYNAVVLGDHLSNYTGKYFIEAPLIFRQDKIDEKFDVLICFGEMNYRLKIPSKEVWRVSTSENIVDPDLNLSNYFNCEPLVFLKSYNRYIDGKDRCKSDLYDRLKFVYQNLHDKIKELPFSNAWVAKRTIERLPSNSFVFYGIATTLRVWNFFEISRSIRCYSTVGGFGIDGTLSSMIGSSIINKDILHFAIIGDLSFFYDINCLGNRHVGKNIRVMCINNNGGYQMLFNNGMKEQEPLYANVAAENHFKGKESIIKAYSEALGLCYLFADNKEEYIKQLPLFLNETSDKGIIFEVKYNGDNDVISQNELTSLNNVFYT